MDGGAVILLMLLMLAAAFLALCVLAAGFVLAWFAGSGSRLALAGFAAVAALELVPAVQAAAHGLVDTTVLSLVPVVAQMGLCSFARHRPRPTPPPGTP